MRPLSPVLTLLLLACGDRPTAPPAPMTGKEVFAMACARCHGVRGAGDGPKAARLGPMPSLERPLDRAAIHAVVVNGRGLMPPHAGRLSPEQIDRVVEYVGTLAP